MDRISDLQADIVKVRDLTEDSNFATSLLAIIHSTPNASTTTFRPILNDFIKQIVNELNQLADPTDLGSKPQPEQVNPHKLKAASGLQVDPYDEYCWSKPQPEQAQPEPEPEQKQRVTPTDPGIGRFESLDDI